MFFQPSHILQPSAFKNILYHTGPVISYRIKTSPGSSEIESVWIFYLVTFLNLRKLIEMMTRLNIIINWTDIIYN